MRQTNNSNLPIHFTHQRQFSSVYRQPIYNSYYTQHVNHVEQNRLQPPSIMDNRSHNVTRHVNPTQSLIYQLNTNSDKIYGLDNQQQNQTKIINNNVVIATTQTETKINDGKPQINQQNIQIKSKQQNSNNYNPKIVALIKKILKYIINNDSTKGQLLKLYDKIKIVHTIDQLNQRRVSLVNIIKIQQNNQKQVKDTIVQMVQLVDSEFELINKRNQQHSSNNKNYQLLEKQFHHYKLNTENQIINLQSKLKQLQQKQKLIYSKQLEKKKNEQQSLENQITKIANQLNKCNKQKEDAFQNIQLQRKQLNQMREKINQYHNLQQKNKTLMNELTEKMNNVSSLRRQINKLEKDFKNTQNLLLSKQSQFNQLVKQMEKIKLSNVSMEEQLQNMKNYKDYQIKKVENFNELGSPTVFKYKRSFHNLAESKQNGESSYQHLQEENQQYKDNSTKLINQINNENKQKKQSSYIKLIPVQNTDKNSDKDMIIEDKNKQIQSYNDIIQDIKNQNLELKKVFQQQRNKYLQYIKSAQSKIEHLNIKLAQSEQNMKELLRYYILQDKTKVKSSFKLFENQIIYQLKKQNQALKRRLFEKLLNYDIKSTLQDNLLDVSKLNVKDKHTLSQFLIKFQLQIKQIIAIVDQNISQVGKVMLKSIKQNVLNMQKKLKQKDIYLSYQKHKRNQSLQAQKSQFQHNDNDQSNRQVKYYKEKNKQLEDRSNQLIFMNRQLKSRIQQIMKKTFQNSTTIFYKQELLKKDKQIKKIQDDYQKLKNQNQQLKAIVQNTKPNKSRLYEFDSIKFLQLQQKLQQANVKINDANIQKKKYQNERNNLISEIENLLKYGQKYLTSEVTSHLQSILINYDYPYQNNILNQIRYKTSISQDISESQQSNSILRQIQQLKSDNNKLNEILSQKSYKYTQLLSEYHKYTRKSQNQIQRLNELVSQINYKNSKDNCSSTATAIRQQYKNAFEQNQKNSVYQYIRQIKLLNQQCQQIKKNLSIKQIQLQQTNKNCYEYSNFTNNKDIKLNEVQQQNRRRKNEVIFYIDQIKRVIQQIQRVTISTKMNRSQDKKQSQQIILINLRLHIDKGLQLIRNLQNFIYK